MVFSKLKRRSKRRFIIANRFICRLNEKLSSRQSLTGRELKVLELMLFQAIVKAMSLAEPAPVAMLATMNYFRLQLSASLLVV